MNRMVTFELKDVEDRNSGKSWRGRSGILACVICGVKFRTYLSIVKLGRKYCSKKCACIGWRRRGSVE